MHLLKASLRPLLAAVGLWGHKGGRQEIRRGPQEKGVTGVLRTLGPTGLSQGRGCWGGGKGCTNAWKEM